MENPDYTDIACRSQQKYYNWNQFLESFKATAMEIYSKYSEKSFASSLFDRLPPAALLGKGTIWSCACVISDALSFDTFRFLFWLSFAVEESVADCIAWAPPRGKGACFPDFSLRVTVGTGKLGPPGAESSSEFTVCCSIRPFLSSFSSLSFSCAEGARATLNAAAFKRYAKHASELVEKAVVKRRAMIPVFFTVNVTFRRSKT